MILFLTEKLIFHYLMVDMFLMDEFMKGLFNEPIFSKAKKFPTKVLFI